MGSATGIKHGHLDAIIHQQAREIFAAQLLGEASIAIDQIEIAAGWPQIAMARVVQDLILALLKCLGELLATGLFQDRQFNARCATSAIGVAVQSFLQFSLEL